MVRLRRTRDHAQAVRAVEERVAARQAEHERTRVELAAAREAVDREEIVSGARVRLIQEHTQRRLAAYRRRLVRSHPDGDWVNVAMDSAAPQIPGWAVRGFEATGIAEASPFEESPAEPAEELAPQPEPEIITLGEVTAIGAVATALPDTATHVVITGYGVAAHHATLTRRGNGYRLRDSGRGNGTFSGGVRIRRAELVVGDTFEIGDYEFKIHSGGRLAQRFLGRYELVLADVNATMDGKRLLTDMSITMRAGTLLAVLGPSGAGKSTLFAAVLGELPVQSGQCYHQEQDLRADPVRIRGSLGFVPQGDDTIHKRLTVRQLLAFSDRLRRPSDRKRGRVDRIRKVCADLGIEGKLDDAVAGLSGGERRRVSIALEVLAKPRLLMLDEPTSGLDAAKDNEVMRLLRRYALGGDDDRHGGRSVMTITHSTEHLDLAHDVLVLVSGGRPVHLGSPGTVLTDLGVTEGDYTTLMTRLCDDPGPAVTRYRRGNAAKTARKAAEALRGAHKPVSARPMRRRGPFGAFLRQFPVLIQRQFMLVSRIAGLLGKSQKEAAGSLAALVMPFLVAGVGAALAGLVVHDANWAAAVRPPEISVAGTALSLLVTLSMLSGQALTYSDIVSEFPVIYREHRTGVLAASVVLSKWVVYAVIAVAQGVLATVTFVLVAGGGQRESLVTTGNVELAISLVATAVAAMSAGLLVSVLAGRLEQAVAMATAVAIVQVALSGGLSSLDGQPVLQAMASILPTRWGFAAAASSADLRGIAPGTPPDALWQHDAGQWAFDIGMLGFLTVVFTTLAVYALRGRLIKPPRR
jgi:ABC-type multidrug transport system ATPase subunit